MSPLQDDLPRLDLSLPAAELQVAIRRALAAPLGACVLQGVPLSADDMALEQLAAELGTPLLEAHNLRGGMTCRVELEPDNEIPPYANTPYEFKGHTDCSDFPEPPDGVLLLCEQAAESGGESLLAPLAEILPLLSFEALLGLQQARFLFRKRRFPILFQRAGVNAIRYNRQLSQLFEQVDNLHSDPEAEVWQNQLDRAIVQVQRSLLLRPGECLILNNATTVHGRRAFSGGRRLLKRIRLQLKK